MGLQFQLYLRKARSTKTLFSTMKAFVAVAMAAAAQAAPEADPQLLLANPAVHVYGNAHTQTMGMVQHTNGAVVPDDTLSVKAAKVDHLSAKATAYLNKPLVQAVHTVAHHPVYTTWPTTASTTTSQLSPRLSSRPRLSPSLLSPPSTPDCTTPTCTTTECMAPMACTSVRPRLRQTPPSTTVTTATPTPLTPATPATTSPESTPLPRLLSPLSPRLLSRPQSSPSLSSPPSTPPSTTHTPPTALDTLT